MVFVQCSTSWSNMATTQANKSDLQPILTFFLAVLVRHTLDNNLATLALQTDLLAESVILVLVVLVLLLVHRRGRWWRCRGGRWFMFRRRCWFRGFIFFVILLGLRRRNVWRRWSGLRSFVLLVVVFRFWCDRWVRLIRWRLRFWLWHSCGRVRLVRWYLRFWLWHSCGWVGLIRWGRMRLFAWFRMLGHLGHLWWWWWWWVSWVFRRLWVFRNHRFLGLFGMVRRGLRMFGSLPWR